MSIKYNTNKIIKDSTTIEISDDGEINSSSSYLAQSEVMFSIHGIAYSGVLFPNWITKDKKTTLKWPMPILLVLNLGGDYDLDSNSA